MIPAADKANFASHLPGPISSVQDPRYFEAVYAGVLGKIIGVYLGRPVENWSYDRIAEEIGDVDYYIHEKRGRLLVVTDDDISGTFTFFRALEDYGFDGQISSRQIGQTWLNYLIESATILWWGGLGNSTEHTAYLRLKHGIEAPRSGSAELNTRAVAEQIGAQIFIDAWGLAFPGDPDKAAHFARQAAQVSHDGEAVAGAVVVAALVAAAFEEKSIDKLLDIAVSQIDDESVIAQMIKDLRGWREESSDWRVARTKLDEKYGYHRFPGQCPVVPNHGVIILSLLFGDGSFDESLMIANTIGWDTDCNSGNVGSILGVRNGLAGMEARDWRGPVADRLYMPSADGGRSISDALAESVYVVEAARSLAGLPRLEPKGGARFHFSIRGSVQGWMAETPSNGEISNCEQSLRLKAFPGRGPLVAASSTFIPPEIKDLVTGYVLVANPTLYPSQSIKARFLPSHDPAQLRLFTDHYNGSDESSRVFSPDFELTCEGGEIQWRVPETGGYPIHSVGIELSKGDIDLDSLTWDGVPETDFPRVSGTMWARAWASSLDRFQGVRDGFEYLVKNSGRGFLTQGARAWTDYEMSCSITPRMASACGVVVRYQGLKRHYAVVLDQAGCLRIEKELDGRITLASTEYPFELHQPIALSVQVCGQSIVVLMNGVEVLRAQDGNSPLRSGAMGFVVEDGCMGAACPSVRPI